MYLWRYQLLARDFANEKVSQRQVFHYFISLLIIGIAFSFETALNPVNKKYVIIEGICYLAGVLWCFQANQKVDGKQFLDRLVSFLFVNIGRAAIAMISLMLLFGFAARFGSNAFIPIDSVKSVLDFLLTVSIELCWFFFVRKSILAINSTPSNPTAPASTPSA